MKWHYKRVPCCFSRLLHADTPGEHDESREGNALAITAAGIERLLKA